MVAGSIPSSTNDTTRLDQGAGLAGAGARLELEGRATVAGGGVL